MRTLSSSYRLQTIASSHLRMAKSIIGQCKPSVARPKHLGDPETPQKAQTTDYSREFILREWFVFGCPFAIVSRARGDTHSNRVSLGFSDLGANMKSPAVFHCRKRITTGRQARTGARGLSNEGGKRCRQENLKEAGITA